MRATPRIVLIADCPVAGTGGTEWSVRRITRLLTEKGMKVLVLARSEQNKEDDFAVSTSDLHGATLVTLFPARWHIPAFDHRRFLEDCFREITRIITDFQPDICHVFGTGPGCYAAGIAAKYCRRQLIVSLRGSDLIRDAFDAKRRSQIEWLLRAADARTFVSEEARRFAKAAFATIPNARNFTIHNSTDDRWFRDVETETVRKQLHGLVIGCVGPLREQMGFFQMLGTLRSLLKTRIRATLLIIGGIHERESTLIRELIQTSGLEKNLVITGALPHSEMLSFMKLCHVGLLLPKTEGCPNKLLEFMLAGVPVIAKRIGAIPEIIQEGHRGVLLDSSDPDHVAEEICVLAKNEGKRQKLGAAGRELILAKFSGRVELRRLTKLYHSCTRGPLRTKSTPRV